MDVYVALQQTHSRKLLLCSSGSELVLQTQAQLLDISDIEGWLNDQETDI